MSAARVLRGIADGRRSAVRCAVGAGVLVLVTAGCSGSSEELVPTPSSGRSTPSASAPAAASPAPSADPSAEPADPPAQAAPDEPPAAPGAPPAPVPEALPTSPPVALDQPNDFGEGVTVVLDRIDEVVAQAQGPGEISGPALAIDVTVTNRSDAAVDLGAFLVNLSDAEGDPGLIMFGDPSRPLRGTLAPGEAASGTYVFAVDEGSRSTITVEASYTTQAPTVVFTGDPSTR